MALGDGDGEGRGVVRGEEVGAPEDATAAAPTVAVTVFVVTQTPFFSFAGGALV